MVLRFLVLVSISRQDLGPEVVNCCHLSFFSSLLFFSGVGGCGVLWVVRGMGVGCRVRNYFVERLTTICVPKITSFCSD